jgi:hypothetical protein
MLDALLLEVQSMALRMGKEGLNDGPF